MVRQWRAVSSPGTEANMGTCYVAIFQFWLSYDFLRNNRPNYDGKT